MLEAGGGDDAEAVAIQGVISCSPSCQPWPASGSASYHCRIAVTAKRLDVQVGDVVEIDDRRYEVVPGEDGGAMLEPAMTRTVDEIHSEHGGRLLSSEEFDEHFGDLRLDGEG